MANDKKSKPADKPEVEAPEVAAPEAETPTVEVVESPEVEADPSWPAEQWNELLPERIGQPAWILRAVLTGQPEDRTYTEKEMRSLVQKFLVKPAV